MPIQENDYWVHSDYPELLEAYQKILFENGYEWIISGKTIVTKYGFIKVKASNSKLYSDTDYRSGDHPEQHFHLPKDWKAACERIGRRLPIKVNDDEVEFFPDGSLRVGCTTITKRKAKAIVERRAKVMAEAEGES